MGSERRKQAMFSLDQFIIMVAWLMALFAILFSGTSYLILPSIAAFILLNLGLGVWINRFLKPAENKSYRKHLAIQTVFLVVWAVVLYFMISSNRLQLLYLWVLILLLFYFGIGIASRKKMKQIQQQA